jgi:hypothetical protein
MIIPSPFVSNLGLPALPIIYNISYGLNSTHLLYSGEYTYVPFNITVCAGKFTPHARVAVETNT